MIYKLGDHIIAQGDSTNPELVERVTRGISIRAIVCGSPVRRGVC